jgi:hypothetical protein
MREKRENELTQRTIDKELDASHDDVYILRYVLSFHEVEACVDAIGLFLSLLYLFFSHSSS